MRPGSSSSLAILGMAACLAGCGKVESSGAADAGDPDGAIDAGRDAPAADAAAIPGDPALTASPDGDSIGLCATGTFGWQFTADVDLEVVALSVFDVAPAGLIDSHEVGLFEADGTLLTVATVTPDSANRAGFRTVPIQPLALTAGDSYVVAATNPGSAHTAGTECSDRFAHDDNTPGAIGVAGVITYTGVRSEDTTNAPDPTALVFPNMSGPTPDAFRVGPSFELNQVLSGL